MFKCQFCGKIIENDYQDCCPHCGEELYCPFCDEPLEDPDYCSSCGWPNNQGDL